MTNIYSCVCISDSLFGLSYDEINEMVSSCSDLSTHLIIIENLDNFYICCRDSIEFCFVFNRYFIRDKTCANVNETISCFDLIKYGFKNICELCQSVLDIFLYSFLVKVK